MLLFHVAVWLNSLTLHVATQLHIALIGMLLAFVFLIAFVIYFAQTDNTPDDAFIAFMSAILPLCAGIMASAYVMAAMSVLLSRIALAGRAGGNGNGMFCTKICICRGGGGSLGGEGRWCLHQREHLMSQFVQLPGLYYKAFFLTGGNAD